MKLSYTRTAAFIGLLFCLLSELSSAQVVSAVRFIGLTRTKYSYLRDHIVKTKVGDKIDSVQIKKDVQEIYNLRHFTTVNFTVVPTVDTHFVEVHFIVKESFSMFPVLDAGLTKDFFKIQAGAVDFNSFGRSGNTSLYIRRMGRNTYLFAGDYPYLLKGKNGLAVDINKVGTFEPIYYKGNKSEYSYDVYNVLVMHRYDINLHSYTKIGIGYQYETFRPHTYTELPNNYALRGNAKRFIYRINYRYTKVNLDRINQNGYLIDLSYNGIESNAKKSELYGSSHKLLADLRYYINLNNFTNLAMRIRMGVGKSAFFDQFVLDDNTNLRGIGFKRFRSDSEFVVNIETRQIIYRHRQGILQAVLFNDYSDKQNYIGGGLRAYLEPIHGVVLRCDYGMNTRDFRQGGIVAGIHQYF